MFFKLKDSVEACQESKGFIFKFVSANDAGQTGSHQSGIYMPREFWPLFLDCPGKKGESRDRRINILWQDGRQIDSRFVWYGRKSRSEYRLTRGFSFLDADNVGDLLVLAKIDEDNFYGFLLRSDDAIDQFFTALHLSPTDSDRPHGLFKNQAAKEERFRIWLESLEEDFPPSGVISAKAREFCEIETAAGATAAAGTKTGTKTGTKIDDLLLKWIETEFALFRFIENDRYGSLLDRPFESVEELIVSANRILNRRKSRAGLSLENHLRFIFESVLAPFSCQETTEGKKKPDFIFPDIASYRDPQFPAERLRFLGVKTTCKDRWRQILNEADRIRTKHLFTLQQGISKNQLDEMEKHCVRLVVPQEYRKYFPRSYADKLLSLSEFIELVKPPPV